MTSADFQPNLEGTFYDLPDRTYREAPGISNSMLKHVHPHGDEPGSPAHFQAYLKDPTRFTRPLLLGRIVHAVILRPDDPLETIVLQPEKRPVVAGDSILKKKDSPLAIGDMIPWHNGSTYCQDWQAQQAAAGNIVVTKVEYESLMGMVKSIASHPQASRALRTGAGEVSVFKNFWREVDGKRQSILRKARIDWVSTGNSLVDIKSCQDCRDSVIAETIYKRGYFHQAAMYIDLWNDTNPNDQKTNFVFVFVEKAPPYAVNVIDLHPRAIETGRQDNERNLGMLIDCYETNTWPTLHTEIHSVDLPERAYKVADVPIP